MEAYIAPTFYRVRYTRGGAWCGLKVWFGPPVDPDTGDELDRSWRWQVEFNGRLSDEPERWLLHFNHDGTPVIAGNETTAADYRYLAELHSWATKYAPSDPYADPRKKIDMNAIEPIKF